MTGIPTLEEFSTIAADLLSDSCKLDSFVSSFSKSTEAEALTVGTYEGRSAIKAAAHKVSRYKTALDAARKTATEDLRKRVADINVRGNEAVEKLQALQDRTRLPLTQWETQESARIAGIQATIDRITALGTVSPSDTAESVKSKRAQVAMMEINSAAMGEFLNTALAAQEIACSDLDNAHIRLSKSEADAAELAALRKAAADREARDALVIRERELEALRLDDERRAAEAEATRAVEMERAKQEAAVKAAEDARIEAERRASDALAEQQRKHDAEIARIQREADDKASVERQEKAEAEARETAKREKEARRQANERHRAKIKTEVVAAIVNIQFDHENHVDAANALIDAIVDGRVPHLTITF